MRRAIRLVPRCLPTVPAIDRKPTQDARTVWQRQNINRRRPCQWRPVIIDHMHHRCGWWRRVRVRDECRVRHGFGRMSRFMDFHPRRISIIGRSFRQLGPMHSADDGAAGDVRKQERYLLRRRAAIPGWLEYGAALLSGQGFPIWDGGEIVHRFRIPMPIFWLQSVVIWLISAAFLVPARPGDGTHRMANAC